jgi:hypothetical protein
MLFYPLTPESVVKAGPACYSLTPALAARDDVDPADRDHRCEDVEVTGALFSYCSSTSSIFLHRLPTLTNSIIGLGHFGALIGRALNSPRHSDQSTTLYLHRWHGEIFCAHDADRTVN